MSCLVAVHNLPPHVNT